MSTSAKTFFSAEQQEDIRIAIMNAEMDTSGEIRVHIESTCKGDAMERALEIFHKLEMHETVAQNGVLIYLAIKNRKFGIIGDKGIHEHVSEQYWDLIKSRMLDYFREGKFTEGLVEVITDIGKQLKTFFPYKTDDINELSDEISFS
jgi:uncharacterized membrane protein